ncbi:protein of unknown function [Streptococcus thermophilus]|uniref:Uncharacterized protein n=1 Tax=Streptococcus thermophilus TaxID=1308 RepID=A0A8D6U2S2_STRTR|nr:protein of unknown function [Streptococcus thermophilus]
MFPSPLEVIRFISHFTQKIIEHTNSFRPLSR